MNPATYEYTAASIQSLQPGDSNLGCQDDEGGCARARCPGFQQGALVKLHLGVT